MESNRRILSEHPCETAGICSRLFYTWTIPTFLKGYKRDLEIDDMHRPLNCDRAEHLCGRLEK